VDYRRQSALHVRASATGVLLDISWTAKLLSAHKLAAHPEQKNESGDAILPRNPIWTGKVCPLLLTWSVSDFVLARSN
jgi:hypothetical protein